MLSNSFSSPSRPIGCNISSESKRFQGHASGFASFVYLWEVNGTNITNSGYIAMSVPPEWQIQEVRDAAISVQATMPKSYGSTLAAMSTRGI